MSRTWFNLEEFRLEESPYHLYLLPNVGCGLGKLKSHILISIINARRHFFFLYIPGISRSKFDVRSTALKSQYTFNVVLRFFNSRYKVSVMWDSNPRPSDFRSDALPTELASLTNGWCSTVDVYTRSNIEVQGCIWLLAARQVRPPPGVTLYLSSTSTLASVTLILTFCLRRLL